MSYEDEGIIVTEKVYSPKDIFKGLMSTKPITLPAVDVAYTPVEDEPKKRRSRKIDVNPNETQVTTATQTPIYNETNSMLKQVMSQTDVLLGEIKGELDNVRSSRTLKNKYEYYSQLSGNMTQLLSTKLNVIKEMNSNIKYVNDMEYKKAKDMKEFEIQSDDKYIMDMYNAYLNTPVRANVPMPNTYNMSVPGQDFIPAPDSGARSSQGYNDYINSPQGINSRIASDKNVRQVVIFDQTTGSKAFKRMNMITNEIHHNADVYPENILNDTTIDLKNKIARNANIGETFPLIYTTELSTLKGY